MLTIRSTLKAVLASAAMAFAVVSCGTSDGGTDPGRKRPTTGDDGTGGGDNTGDEDAGGSGGSGGFDDPWTGSDGGDDEDKCSETEEKAQRKPLDMYIMLDKSGSMAWNINGGTLSGGGNNPSSRWYQVKEALKEFASHPQSAGMGVGLGYFPKSSGECNASSYANPDVSIGLLPAHAANIASSLDATSPNGGTPTRYALEGALQYAQQWAVDHPDHSVIVVLATDGEPEGCSGNTMSHIKTVAQTYAAAGIPTFVIGIGNKTGNLNDIATAGGTGQAIMVTGSNATQEFIDAMNAIRGVALACEYQIPPPKEGEQLDYEKVNLRFTSGDGTKEDIPYIGDESACSGNGGWFYDNPDEPTMIKVCPETCNRFKMDDQGQVNVVLGCKRRGPA